MNQRHYVLGIFFLGLIVAGGIFHSILYFRLGTQLYFLQPFANWYLLINITYLMGTLFLLKYFHFKAYRFSFWAGVTTAIVTVCQFVLVYVILIFVAVHLQKYNILMVILSMCTNVTFGLSLILLRDKKISWLKTTGFLMLIIHLVFGAAFIWMVLFGNAEAVSAFEQIQRWALLAGNLIPLSLIMHFRAERDTLTSSERDTTDEKNLNTVFGATGALCLVFTFVLGFRLAQEAYWAVDWNKRGPETAQRLAKAFESKVYINSRGDTLRYLFMKPLDYDSTIHYPLVVCLHGGPVRSVNQVEVPEPAPLLSSTANRKKYPAFIFVPQAPLGHSWGGMYNVPAVDSLVVESIQALEQHLSIDVKRRYVAGGSMGGYGTWHLIGTRPEMFAAAVPYCGSGDPELASNMVDIPVWAFHGSADRNVPVTGSRKMIEAIKRAGGHPLYNEFSGVGHNVWPSVNETPGLLDWLFAQKRDSL